MAATLHGLETPPSLSPPLPWNETAQCQRCEASGGPATFSMAFQPVVDVRSDRIVAYEALARGLNGEPAYTVLEDALGDNRYRLDQHRRIKAIELAASLGIASTGADLSINFFPNAVHEAVACLQHTLRAAEKASLSARRLIFEINEMEQVIDLEHLRRIVLEYRSMGIRTAMDDFGSGFAGLSMLAAFQPDIVKIDIALIRNIHERRASQTIVRAIVEVCNDLGIQMIAEGVERREEVAALQDLGVEYLQGFYLSPPAFEQLLTIESCRGTAVYPLSVPTSAEPVRQRKLLSQFGGTQVLADVGEPLL